MKPLPFVLLVIVSAAWTVGLGQWVWDAGDGQVVVAAVRAMFGGR